MTQLDQVKQEAKDKGVKLSPADTTIAKITKKIKNHEDRMALKNGVVSKDQIDQWKSKHGGVTEISVEVSEGDAAVGYLRKPTRDHKAIALSLFDQHKLLECGEFLVQNCWLGGDERLKDAEDIADSAAIQANSIINFKKGNSRAM